MRRLTGLIFGIALAFSVFVSTRTMAVDFETEPLGTEYGTPAGDSPGDLVFSQDGVNMTVENFTSGAFTGFNVATITGQPGPPTSFFPASVNSTQALTLNNINGRFDFTGLGFDVTKVAVDYADGGDTNNFDVNGLGKQEVNDWTSLTSYPNYTVSVTAGSVGPIVVGTIMVAASAGNRIEWIELGGQESSIDNIVVVPEPNCLLLGLVVLGAGLARRRPRTTPDRWIVPWLANAEQ